MQSNENRELGCIVDKQKCFKLNLFEETVDFSSFSDRKETQSLMLNKDFNVFKKEIWDYFFEYVKRSILRLNSVKDLGSLKKILEDQLLVSELNLKPLTERQLKKAKSYGIAIYFILKKFNKMKICEFSGLDYREVEQIADYLGIDIRKRLFGKNLPPAITSEKDRMWDYLDSRLQSIKAYADEIALEDLKSKFKLSQSRLILYRNEWFEDNLNLSYQSYINISNTRKIFSDPILRSLISNNQYPEGKLLYNLSRILNEDLYSLENMIHKEKNSRNYYFPEVLANKVGFYNVWFHRIRDFIVSLKDKRKKELCLGSLRDYLELKTFQTFDADVNVNFDNFRVFYYPDGWLIMKLSAILLKDLTELEILIGYGDGLSYALSLKRVFLDKTIRKIKLLIKRKNVSELNVIFNQYIDERETRIHNLKQFFSISLLKPLSYYGPNYRSSQHRILKLRIQFNRCLISGKILSNSKKEFHHFDYNANNDDFDNLGFLLFGLHRSIHPSNTTKMTNLCRNNLQILISGHMPKSWGISFNDMSIKNQGELLRRRNGKSKIIHSYGRLQK